MQNVVGIKNIMNNNNNNKNNINGNNNNNNNGNNNNNNNDIFWLILKSAFAKAEESFHSFVNTF